MTNERISIEQLEERARQLRIGVMKIIGKFRYGHVGGSMSVSDIIAVLYFHEMKLDPKNPTWEDRDRFILSKGHACFTQYVALADLGILPKEALNHPYEVDSMIQAHPELGQTPGIEMSTGALGQGLSAGIGMAIGARLRKKDFRTYVVLGDGELNEGQVWEAAMLASKYKLDNLVAIIDYNQLALSDHIKEVMPLEPLEDKWAAFGWHVLHVNGHSVSELVNGLDEARQIKGKPTVILADTIKGYGISFLEDKWNSHATPLTEEEAKQALRELGCPEEEIVEALA